MNRIILIGNGFDLAHGLQTSFKNFIDDYWKKIYEEIIEVNPGSIFENDDIKIYKVPSTWAPGNNFDTFKRSIPQGLGFKNKFLQRISEKCSLNKWVDIENEYYLVLKEAFQMESKYPVDKLNSDFEVIRQALIKYITDIENNSEINDQALLNQIGSKIYSEFEYVDFSEMGLNNRAKLESEKVIEIAKGFRFNEITFIPDNKLHILTRKVMHGDVYKNIRSLLLSRTAPNYFDLFPEKLLFLNFNYTKTDKYYQNPSEHDWVEYDFKPKVSTISIHGSIYKYEYNPVIFGFGDEIDESYKTLENLNDNRFLEHIKSVKYLETDNYKRLLEFINSDDYQVFIFGHSCGISDRTLLNTLFEHNNCVSIKPFFHRKGETEDNYSEITMNITRNFNNKASLRDKVVNKRFCAPLVLK